MSALSSLYQGGKYGNMPFVELMSGLRGNEGGFSGSRPGPSPGGANNPLAQGIIGGLHALAPNFFNPNIQQGVNIQANNDNQLQSELQNVTGTFQKNLQALGAQPGDANAIRRAYLQTIGDPNVGLHMTEPVWQMFNKNMTDLLSNATGKTAIARPGEWGIDEDTGHVKFQVPAADKFASSPQGIFDTATGKIASPALNNGLDDMKGQSALVKNQALLDQLGKNGQGNSPMAQTLKSYIAAQTGNISEDDPAVQSLAKSPYGTEVARGKMAMGTAFGGNTNVAAVQRNAASVAMKYDLMKNHPEFQPQMVNGQPEWPLYDQNAFMQRQTFTKDVANKYSNLYRSDNVVLQHLQTLKQIVDQINAGGQTNMQLANKALQGLNKQFGGTGPTSLAAVTPKIAAELNKLWVGSPGGTGGAGTGEERANDADAVALANSPQQNTQVIDKWNKLLVGAVNGQRSQYNANTGYTDFDDRYLQKGAQNTLSTYGYPAAQYKLNPYRGLSDWHDLVEAQSGQGGSAAGGGGGETPTVPKNLAGMDGLMYNAKTNQYRDKSGAIYDASGQPLTAQPQPPANNGPTPNQQ